MYEFLWELFDKIRLDEDWKDVLTLNVGLHECLEKHFPKHFFRYLFTIFNTLYLASHAKTFSISILLFSFEVSSLIYICVFRFSISLADDVRKSEFLPIHMLEKFHLHYEVMLIHIIMLQFYKMSKIMINLVICNLFYTVYVCVCVCHYFS